MKKIICVCLLLSVACALFSQSVPVRDSSIKTDYLKKSKNQKTTAWVLLGGGFALTTIGSVLALNDLSTGLGNIFNPDPEPTHSGTGAEVLVITGVASMLGSIPFFISASKNKHKAMSITFKNDFIPELQKGSIVKVPLPGVSLMLRF